MEVPVSSPWAEWVGTSQTTVTDGETLNLDVFIPEFIPDIQGCPGKVIDQKVGVPFMWQCPGGCHMIHIKRTVTCTYLGQPNSIVPCVHKGERVRVLNYACNEQMYWLPLGRDPGLRLHERIRWFAMSQPSSVVPESYKEVMDTNSYFIDFNTNKGSKQWHLHTSKADGEPVGYDWYIWPEKGEMVFHDCKGNFLHLWTQEHKWQLHNVDDSNVILDKQNIFINCKDSIYVDAGKNIVVNAGVSYSRKSPTQTVNGDNYSKTMSATITENAATHTVVAPDQLRTGNLNWNGNMVLGGGTIANGMSGHACPNPLACW